jgi:hypothetical protein
VIAATMAASFSPVMAEILTLGEMYGEGITAEVVGPVAIVLNDGSTDGCWTNLRDVREYGEEKLAQEGFVAATEGQATAFTLLVQVNAHRERGLFGAGRCRGHIGLSLVDGMISQSGIRGNFIAADLTASVLSENSVNDDVVRVVGAFLTAIADGVEAE